MTESAFDTAPESVRRLTDAMEPGAKVMAVRINPDGSRTVSSYTVGPDREQVDLMTTEIPARWDTRLRYALARRLRCLGGGHMWESPLDGTITCRNCQRVHVLGS